MSLTQLEIDICNQALSQIGAAKVVLATQSTSVEGIRANDFYAQTRDSLLRSFNWNFAKARSVLSQLKTIEFDTSPGPNPFAVGDVITGVSSGATATILTVTSDVEYEITYLSGTFTDGETITNASVQNVAWNGIPVVYGTDNVVWYESGDQVVCGIGYPIVTSVTPEFTYQYKFVLPSDFDRFCQNHPGSYRRYAIEGNYVLSDDTTFNCRYIRKVTDTTLFDPLFIEILVLQLQLKFIPAIAGTNTPGLIDRIERRLASVTARARAINHSENEQSGRSDWNNARYFSGKILPSHR